MGFVLIVVAAYLNFGVVPGDPAPTAVAHRHFSDELSCERAAAASVAAPGTKLVCVAAGPEAVLSAAN